MNLRGLNVALMIATTAGLVFGLLPEWDIALSAVFFDPRQRDFTLRWVPELGHLRDVAMWVVMVLAAPAIVALVLKFLRPRSRMIIPGRAALFLFWTLVLAPGVFANLLLKENWNRQRPINVSQFSGSERFTPWWDPRGACPKNCSFVSGEGSAAFWTLAPAALAPPQWRPLAYGAALGFGVAVGALRVGFGAHFVSDVVFAGVFTFLIIWLVHGAVYRWHRTQVTDAKIGRRTAWLMAPFHGYVRNRFGRLAPAFDRLRNAGLTARGGRTRGAYPAPSATATL